MQRSGVKVLFHAVVEIPASGRVTHYHPIDLDVIPAHTRLDMNLARVAEQAMWCRWIPSWGHRILDDRAVAGDGLTQKVDIAEWTFGLPWLQRDLALWEEEVCAAPVVPAVEDVGGGSDEAERGSSLDTVAPAYWITGVLTIVRDTSLVQAGFALHVLSHP